MRGGPSLKGKGGLVGFRRSLKAKEGQAALLKNPHYKQKKLI